MKICRGQARVEPQQPGPPGNNRLARPHRVGGPWQGQSVETTNRPDDFVNERWPTTRTSLLARIQNPDDTVAWGQMVDVYGTLIYRYCLSRGIQPADAEDITSEVLKKISEFRYHPERGKFRSWLGRVVRNQVFLFWRRQRKSVRIDEPEDRGTVHLLEMSARIDWERMYHAHILDVALQRIRGEFDKDAWRAFELVALSTEVCNGQRTFSWRDDASAQAVAETMGRRVEWVYKTKSRIMRRLREEILLLAEEIGLLK